MPMKLPPAASPREIAIATIVRRLLAWQSWQLLSHEAYKANINTAGFLTEEQKAGYLLCLDDTIEMLKNFPLRVEHTNGQIIVTLDSQSVSKGTLQ
ncbi:MAG: hypothetical protein NC112_09100 [Oxalobacter formigenes]|nr:hypothetical protein [Oxalobacter formigenes]